MTIILGYLVFCFAVSLESKKYPKATALLIFLVGTFINGFRSVSYTGDNLAYAQYYILNSTVSLSESWHNVVTQSGKDPFYYFAGNLFSKLGFSYRGWFVFVAFVYMAGFCYVMYKYSKNYFMSILFLVTLSYFQFSMTGLRQTLAMGICFFAYDMACTRRPVLFVILVLLASMFHSSALIFLPLYFMLRIEIGYKHWIAVLTAVFTAYMIPSFINNVVSFWAWNENLEVYSYVTTGLTISGFVIQAAIIVFCHFYTNVEDKVNCQSLLNAMFVGIVFQAFAINIDNIFRMSMYFSVYGAFMTTEATESQTIHNKRILYVIVGGFLIFYMLRAGTYRNLTLFGEI